MLLHFLVQLRGMLEALLPVRLWFGVYVQM